MDEHEKPTEAAETPSMPPRRRTGGHGGTS